MDVLVLIPKITKNGEPKAIFTCKSGEGLLFSCLLLNNILCYRAKDKSNE
jgi:hypothetical protein